MPAAPSSLPPVPRRRRRCAQGCHAADPATVRIDGRNRRATCRWCKRPIVRAIAIGRWIVSGYLD